ncbi:MAG: anthranilate phosphoribosyltransferase [Thermoleophilia bacterium]|nr:anthranilate phosphoribosyltransferase [Thermoleophilia bacterium]
MSDATASPLILALKRLGEGRDLSAAEAEAAVGEILEGRATEPALAAFLTALKVKGETADELAGAVASVLAHAATDGLAPAPAGALDTCGTGGDGANTVNVSTATAVVVAACGVPVVKHGNRSASGNSGSAEVLGELGVKIDPDRAILNATAREPGIAFLFAPAFHPGLRHAAPVRKALPFRTLFNLVGPLANPARPEHQLLGVAGDRQADLVAGALSRLGPRRAAVVTGSDGLDEVTLGGTTRVRLVEAGAITTREWSPASFGLDPVPAEALRVAGPAESAARIRELFAGRPGPFRSIVLANAAAALWVAGRCGDDLADGVALAATAIDRGDAASLLERWARLTHGG